MTTPAIPVGGRCSFLRAKLAQTVADVRQAGSVEKATTLVKAGYLTTIKTPLRNLLGNGAMAGLEAFVAQPTAFAMDYLLATGRAAATRFDVPASAFREVAAPSIAGLRFGAAGFREGLHKAINVMRTGVDPDIVNTKFDLQRVTYDTPALNKAVHTVFDFMEASDKPWFGFAYNASLFNTAEVLALKEGLKGTARTKRVNELLAHPTDEMQLRALDEAQYATFKNKTVLGKVASGLKERARRAGTSQKEIDTNPRAAAAMRVTGKTVYGLSEMFLPFTSVPTAIAGVALDYSPLGFVKALALELPKETRSQGQFAKRLARAGAGTAATFTLGYALAKEGKMTGSAPSSPSERAEWDAEGKQPNSVLIKGRWYSMQAFAPAAFPLILGANLYQASVGKPDAGLASKAAQVAMFEGKALSEQTFLTGLRTITDALADPDRNASKIGQQLLPIPPLVGQVAAGVDPTVRSTSGGIGDRLRARIPGASKGLEPKLDQFGREIKRSEGGIGGMAKELLDVTNSRASRADDVTKELSRLRVFPGLPGRLLHVMKQPVTMSPADYTSMIRELGAETHKALRDAIHDPDYRAMSDQDRANYLQRIIAELRGDARNEWKGRQPPGGSSGGKAGAKPAARDTSASAPYDKDGQLVVDTHRRDAGGHVPTHRVGQASNKRSDETWKEYEDRVLARSSFSADTSARRDVGSLESDVRSAADGLLAAAERDGVALKVAETRRSQERQEMLFQRGRSKSGSVVTWTLTSDHSPGRAIDFTGNAAALQWLQSHASDFGFKTLGDIDPGHVSLPIGSRVLASRGP